MTKIVDNFKLTLKFTDSRELVVDVDPTTSIEQLKAIVQADTEAPLEKIKLIYKGKITTDADTLKLLGIIKPSTIIVVINKFEKSKPVQQPKQSIPTNFQTGLGNFNPVGFGNYGIMNHPQYMSTLSGLNEDKLEEMMDDPFYESMMEELLKDPETMVKMMQDNPLTKKMMESNPMMKVMMSNPETLKMIINPETMKMMKQMKKNGGGLGAGGLGGLGGIQGFGGFGGGNTASTPGLANPMSGFGWPGMMPNLPNQTSQTSQSPQLPPHPFQNFGMGMGMNPLFGGFNPYMGAGLNPVVGNPFQNLNPTANSTGNAAKSPSEAKPMESCSTVEPDEQVRFAKQIKELQQMGFTDKEKILAALRKAKGKLDDAIDDLDE